MSIHVVSEEASSGGGFYEYHGKYPGILSWIFSTDHKRIGLLYLASILTFVAAGVSLGFLMRLELMAPGPTIMRPQTYNALFTLHGVIMVFLFVIPGFPAVFGNFFLPIQIGARDVAFPRVNLLSWWVYMAGAVLAVLSLFTGGGPIDTGWTFYAPYSLRTTVNVPLAVLGVFVLGFSSILTGINFVTTIHRLRAPGMTWFRLPLFVWSLYATAWIQILATPVVGITLLLTLAERLAGVGVFDPTKGGDPILYQHLFWIYSHPAVYIMILPAMGVISEIIPGLLEKDHLRLQGGRLFKRGHRPGRFLRVGTPHVRERPERSRLHHLLPADFSGGHPERREGLQLGGHPVQRLH